MIVGAAAEVVVASGMPTGMTTHVGISAESPDPKLKPYTHRGAPKPEAPNPKTGPRGSGFGVFILATPATGRGDLSCQVKERFGVPLHFVVPFRVWGFAALGIIYPESTAKLALNLG